MRKRGGRCGSWGPGAGRAVLRTWLLACTQPPPLLPTHPFHSPTHPPALHCTGAGPGGQGQRPVGHARRGAGGRAHALHGAHELPGHAGTRQQRGQGKRGVAGACCGWVPGRLLLLLMMMMVVGSPHPPHAHPPQASIVGKARAKEKAIARITALRSKCVPLTPVTVAGGWAAGAPGGRWHQGLPSTACASVVLLCAPCALLTAPLLDHCPLPAGSSWHRHPRRLRWRRQVPRISDVKRRRRRRRRVLGLTLRRHCSQLVAVPHLCTDRCVVGSPAACVN